MNKKIIILTIILLFLITGAIFYKVNKQSQKPQIQINNVTECKVDTDCPTKNHCECKILYVDKNDEGGIRTCECVSKE